MDALPPVGLVIPQVCCVSSQQQGQGEHEHNPVMGQDGSQPWPVTSGYRPKPPSQTLGLNPAGVLGSTALGLSFSLGLLQRFDQYF